MQNLFRLAILKTFNWLLLILVCQCHFDIILANRLMSRNRYLDSEQVYNHNNRVKPVYHDSNQYPETIDKLSYNGHNLNEHSKFYMASTNNNNHNEIEDEYRNYSDDICNTPDSRFGTCYDASICAERGGTPMGRCTGGKGHVCCLFETTCGQMIRERHVYFRNPNYPFSYDVQRICRAKIHKIDSNGAICQLKLIFQHFDIAKPIEGNCTQDSFLISGQNENNIVPRICGHNTGQHYYIGVDESGMVTLHMVFRGSYPRMFNIHIEQIDCGSKKTAPANCLQYYEGTQGTIKSFNYDSQEMGNSHDITNIVNEGYPNNIDYMICIRKETGFCSISYEFMSDHSGAVLPFSVGLMPNQFSKRTGILEHWDTGKAYSTIQTTQCEDDYLIVSGTKVCTKIVDPGNDEKEILQPTEHPFPEDLITPGNITENISNNNELNGNLSERKELKKRNQRQTELFQDALTRRYRWMHSAPITLKKDQFKRIQQNYLMATDLTPGPFQLRFVSNSINNAKGFYLAFRQNPCKM